MKRNSEKSCDNKYPCSCCDYFTLLEPPGRYGICPVCFWEDDLIQQLDPSFVGGANQVNLKTARENYKKIGASEERFLKYVRSPKENEISKNCK